VNIDPHARCARHPERLAWGPCPRCGTFTCQECRPTWVPTHCVNCAEFAPRPSPEGARTPGICIAVLAGLQTALFGLVAPLMVYEALTGKMLISEPGEEPADLGAAAVSMVLLAIHVALLVGGIQFARLKSRNWAMFASIAVMIPCAGPCCLIGIPLGIWGITTLNKLPPETWGRETSP
jgi:hypothetical protein